jgi:hypothetical protein
LISDRTASMLHQQMLQTRVPQLLVLLTRAVTFRRRVPQFPIPSVRYGAHGAPSLGIHSTGRGKACCSLRLTGTAFVPITPSTRSQCRNMDSRSTSMILWEVQLILGKQVSEIHAWGLTGRVVVNETRRPNSHSSQPDTL